MSWGTLTFSEKWLYTAKQLQPENQIKFLEVVFNYGLFGLEPYNELPKEVSEAFEAVRYEIDLLNANSKARKILGEILVSGFSFSDRYNDMKEGEK